MKKNKSVCIRVGLCLSVAIFAVILSGCSVADKSWGSVSSIDAFKVSVSDPAGSGTLMPQIIAGGGISIVSFVKPFDKDKNYPTIIKYGRRKSMWSVFSTDADFGNIGFSYISGSNSSPEAVAEQLKAIAMILSATGKSEKTTTSAAQ